jgi:hypothetical protein
MWTINKESLKVVPRKHLSMSPFFSNQFSIANMKAIHSLLLLPFAFAVPMLLGEPWEPGKQPSFPRNPEEPSAFTDIDDTFSSIALIQSIPPSSARVSSAADLYPIYIQICLDPDWKNCRYAMKDANICFNLEAPFDRKYVLLHRANGGG